MNYTLPYYETEGNVCWLQDLNWCFGRIEYETMVQEFWERTTLEQVKNIGIVSGGKNAGYINCRR